MNKLTEKQVQKLIDFVQARPGLYDKRDAGYKRVEWKERSWKEIASHLCVDERDCKAAWRCLKDQFVRRHKEIKGKTGQAADKMTRKYKNFERLLFLKDSIEPRKHESNFDDNFPERESAEVVNLFAELTSFNTVANPETSPVESESMYATTSSSSSAISRKRKISSLPETSYDFEACACTWYTKPLPELSPEFDNSISGSSSSAKKKAEVKEEFAGFLDKLANYLESKEPDNIDLFFKSIAKSVKEFNLTPVEVSTLMVRTTQLLQTIILNREK